LKYIVTRAFFTVKANGDHTPVPVGTTLTAKQFATLTPQKQEKCQPAGLDALLVAVRNG